MTRVLLDFPWALDAAIGPDPEPYAIVMTFLDLLGRPELEAVRFIEDEERANFHGVLSSRKGGGRFGPVLRFIHHCERNGGGNCLAVPVIEPPHLRNSWKCALRDELGDFTDWRNPQIVVPRIRRSRWSPGKEVDVNCEQCGNEPASGPHQRVLVVLEDYETHPFAIPDSDPWRHLEQLFPPKVGHPNQNPCRLPRPPALDGIQLSGLSTALEEARRQGWDVNGKYYFIPGADPLLEQVAKEAWRSGRAFARQTVRGWRPPCVVDYRNRVWRWDDGHRHWDVQLDDGYMRIGYNGQFFGYRRT